MFLFYYQYGINNILAIKVLKGGGTTIFKAILLTLLPPHGYDLWLSVIYHNLISKTVSIPHPFKFPEQAPVYLVV